MSTSKHFDKFCIAAVAVTLVITILFMCGGQFGLSVAARTVKYQSTLFDTSYVHRIDIVMNDWDDFIETCENEEYSVCTVVVDGVKHSNIAIRAKGNTSLSSVRSSGSQRYSFKLEFDHYESAKMLDGLDKLCLNNLIQDNTMMKDYLVYMMMGDFGVDSPLCSFAYLTVNGEDWGLYLAVEGIEDSFLSRNYGTQAGDLYKPDSLSFGGGRGNGQGFNFDDLDFDFFGESGGSGEEGGSEGGEGSGTAQSTATPGGMGGFDPSSMFPGMGGSSDSSFPGGSFPGMGGSGDSSFPGGSFPGMGGSGDSSFPGGSFPGMGGSGDSSFPGGSFPGMGGSGDSAFPGGSFPGQGEGSSFDPGSMFPGQDGSGESGEGGSQSFDPGSSMPGGMGGMGGFGGMGSDDVKLKYIDDNPESYSNIFDSAKTAVSSVDQKRLIESLKKLSSYTDLEDVLDMDEVLRYFVVHNFVCNSDSYTGTMIHNYYLHESDGKLAMIPWDYNLAFGTFQGGSASSSVNASIDNPVSGSVDERPMVGWIFSDQEYTDRYHELFNEFIEKWFTNGELEKLIEDTAAMIRPYVEKDPTKFCTLEEFDQGVSVLSEFVSLRAEAVSRQLNGDSTAVDTGDINLSDMGSMGGSMGGGMGGFSGMSGMDPVSMIKLTDKDGNEVELSSLIEDTSKIASFTLSDGTEIDLASADMRELMASDLSSVVSLKDKDGNVIDLSEYSVSFSMPSGGGSGSGRGSRPSSSGHGGFSGTSAPSDGTQPDASGAPQGFPDMGSFQGGSMPDVGSFPGSSQSGEAQPDASGAPEGSSQSGSSGSSSGSSRPQMPSGSGSGFSPSGSSSSNSQANFWILTGASVIVLAIGLLIAAKMKY